MTTFVFSATVPRPAQLHLIFLLQNPFSLLLNTEVFKPHFMPLNHIFSCSTNTHQPKMGSVSSKKDDRNVVCQCKERKRLLKLVLERRSSFAYAQCKYILSLLTVAKGIEFLVAKLSTPPSPELITYPSTSDSNETTENNTTSHQQTPTETNLETSSEKEKEKQEQEEKTPVDKSKVRVKDQKCEISVVVEEKSEGGEEEDDDDVVSEHFYDGVAQPMPVPSLQREVQTAGWDFFRPYDRLKTQLENGFVHSYDENFLRMLREEDGIPGLEEVEEDVMSETKFENACIIGHNVVGITGVVKGESSYASQGETEKVKVSNPTKTKSGFSGGNASTDAYMTSDSEGPGVMKATETPTDESEVSNVKAEDDDENVNENRSNDMIVIDAPTNGRELLEALKDIEGYFVRAYESGLDVSKMLEAKNVHLQTGLEGLKKGSSKIFRSKRKHLPTSSPSSSCMSIFSSSPVRSSSTWNDFKTELFDADYATMESGSHTFTLSKLYAWEKKLYDDVMAGEQSRKRYVRKCIQLSHEDARGGPFSGDKTRAKLRALHATISVSLRCAESISDRIIKVKDEELHPQLVELLRGLKNTWMVMSELHEYQSKVMHAVSSFNCPTYRKFSNKSHRLATLELGAQLKKWRACFAEYVSAQKAYLEALDGWLSKCFGPEVEGNDRPTLLVTVHEWLASLEKLPTEAVKSAMKNFGKDIKALYVQQGKEQEQKKKVDGLAKTYDKKVSAFQKVESKILGSKLSEEEVEIDLEDRIEYLAGRKNSLEMIKNRLEEEKSKQFSGTQDTQRITLIGIQTGFSSVFESLVGFSKASVKMYANLVAHNENATGTDGNSGNPANLVAHNEYATGTDGNSDNPANLVAHNENATGTDGNSGNPANLVAHNEYATGTDGNSNNPANLVAQNENATGTDGNSGSSGSRFGGLSGFKLNGRTTGAI